jgi:hypothetical protein
VAPQRLNAFSSIISNTGARSPGEELMTWRDATNHPGFVVFDEPRRQATREISFQALLERASEAKSNKQQVIFATSESRERLSGFLATVDCSFLAFDGYILTRLS